jgi:hypothetical protein
MSGPLHLRIFISSPGDVQDERNLTRQLIKDELPYDPLLRGRLTLDAVAWDDPAAGVPMLATMTRRRRSIAAFRLRLSAMSPWSCSGLV